MVLNGLKEGGLRIEWSSRYIVDILVREITFLHRKYICLLYCTAISEVNFILSALKHGVTLKKELIDRCCKSCY